MLDVAQASATPTRADPTGVRLVRWLFVRGVAATFVVAFASLAIQIRGLVGSDGILPAHELIDAWAGRLGLARLWRVPTLVWWTGASDTALVGLCVVIPVLGHASWHLYRKAVV